MFSPVFICFSVFFTWHATFNFFNAVRSVNWPQVTGTIVNSRIDVKKRSMSSHNSSLYDMYCPRVQYTYSVANVYYSNDILGYNRSESVYLSEADSWLASFPAGARVPVYYDPSYPQNACLIPGYSYNVYFFMYMGFVPLFIVLSTLLILKWDGSYVRN